MLKSHNRSNESVVYPQVSTLFRKGFQIPEHYKVGDILKDDDVIVASFAGSAGEREAVSAEEEGRRSAKRTS